MKNEKRAKASSDTNEDICSIENPCGAIDFYMPLPDDVYKKWKKQK